MEYGSGDPFISQLEHVLICFVKHGDLDSIYRFEEKDMVGEEYFNWCLYSAYRTIFSHLDKNISDALESGDISFCEKTIQVMMDKLKEFNIFIQRTDEIVNYENFLTLDKYDLSNEYNELWSDINYYKNVLSMVLASRNCKNDEDKVLNMALKKQLLLQN